MGAHRGKVLGIGVAAAVVLGVWVWVRWHRDSDVLTGDAETAKASVPGSLGKLATGESGAEAYKGPAISGLVKTTGGTPVSGARVMVATGRNVVVMTLDGSASKDYAGGSAETGADGRFTVQPNARPRAIFVRGAQGYAYAMIPGSSGASASAGGAVQLPSVTLQPWGRVEVLVGPGVEAGSQFNCSSDPRFMQAGVYFGINSQARAGANLVLEQVPVGRFALAVRGRQGATGVHSYETMVQAGQTAVMRVGQAGRTVAGRVDKPVAGFAMRRATLSMKPSSGTAAAMTEMLDTRIERDGTFRFDRVSAGQYSLHLQLYASDGDAYELAGEAQQSAEVAGVEGKDEKAMDLGVVTVNVPERFAIGQKGKDIGRLSLSQFRGRYVLVVVTDGPGKTSWNDVMAIRPVFDRFASREELAVVTAYVGTAVEKARQEAIAAGVNWEVPDCGDSIDGVPNPYLGKKHWVTVLDPQGVILASNVDAMGAWAVLDGLMRGAGSMQSQSGGGGGVKVQVERLTPGESRGASKKTPAPSADDAATGATITLVDGKCPEGADPRACLTDGKMPTDEDSRDENFRLAIGTLEGRVKFDLGKVIPVAEIRSYSWHTDTRAPQVYRVFGAVGSGAAFDGAPKFGKDPEKCGWTLIAEVDARPDSGPPGGKYAVSVSRDGGILGEYRYLLFEMFPTEAEDGNGNTFYSEIDVIRGR